MHLLNILSATLQRVSETVNICRKSLGRSRHSGKLWTNNKKIILTKPDALGSLNENRFISRLES